MGIQTVTASSMEIDAAVAATAADAAAAILAKTQSEAARDASIVNAQTYATEALGRAAVADGATFDVQGSGDVASYRYRRTDSSTSVLIATFPAKAAVDNVPVDLTKVAGATLGPPSATGQVAFFDAISGITDEGGKVSAWKSYGNTNRLEAYDRYRPLRMPDSIGFLDDHNSGKHYIGTKDVKPQRYAELVECIPLPAATNGADSGGFTITGLSFNPQRGLYACGNDGRKDVDNLTPQTPTIVLLRADKRSVYAEYDLTALYPAVTWGTVQGVQWDLTDNSIWFADQANNKVRHLSLTGSVIAGDEITTDSTPNGLARSEADDALFVHYQGSGPTTTTFKKYSCVDGSLLETISMPTAISSADHIQYDDATKFIYVSAGANNADASLFVVCTISKHFVTRYQLRNSHACEGFYVRVEGGYFYIELACDGGFHSDLAVPPTNRINVYRTDVLPPAGGPAGATNMMISLCFRRVSTSVDTVTDASGFRVLVSNEDPIGTSGGWAIATVSGADQIYFYARDIGAAANYVKAWDITSVGEFENLVFVWTFGVGIDLYIDGSNTPAAVDSVVGSIASAAQPACLHHVILGARKSISSGENTNRFVNSAFVKCLGIFNTDTDRQKVAGYQAWRAGITAKLSVDNAYASTPPW